MLSILLVLGDKDDILTKLEVETSIMQNQDMDMMDAPDSDEVE